MFFSCYKMLYKINNCNCNCNCLSFPTCDWSQLHAGIACLVFLSYDRVTACWDSLSMLLHAGIVCVASLASGLVTACLDSLVALSMLGQLV